ncbi:MAG: hypothetical protein D3918_09405 [Candidatus Electrothrix sp. AX2]|nr:hypothetical protein [Candidatus Electrothrix gigas]
MSNTLTLKPYIELLGKKAWETVMFKILIMVLGASLMNPSVIGAQCEQDKESTAPRGCWCSGPKTHPISNIRAENDGGKRRESDKIIVTLSDSIAPESCGYRGFLDKNTKFRTRTINCFDPECKEKTQYTVTYTAYTKGKECDFSIEGTQKDKQRCFGAAGNQCEKLGDILHPPKYNNKTCMVKAYVTAGSQAHDQCCINHPNGRCCKGWNPLEDVVLSRKRAPCSDEWDTAFDDSQHSKGSWRTFGPYYK